MKTKHWIFLFVLIIAACLGSMLLFSPTQDAAFARITVDGELFATVSLAVDRQIDVNGHNTVTVHDGKIAVTWADCPDHYCMDRGYCSGGTDIVCLPNRMVITFLGEQEIDGVSG